MRPTKKCPKCREYKKMTRHHVYPRRHFGKRNNNVIFHLCRECHVELETRIPFYRIKKHRYVVILLRFLEE